ncbi:MAG: hypothetical protein IH950_08560 [Bacteroidetes bacterium]|nr:hypothetical protein [Bacteroidota bacterium]
MKQSVSDNPRGSLGIPFEYILLILAGILLLLAFVLFDILPPEVPIDSYRTAVLSFLAALAVAAIGNIIIGLIQKGVSREAARALTNPIQDLDSAVEKLRQIQVFYGAGVVGVFPNRSAAMRHFIAEIEREDRTIDFVGTSMLGSIDPAEENEDKRTLQRLLKRKKQNGVRIRSLLMHPAYGEFRERVENRERAAVAKDIQGTLRYLLQSTSGQTTSSDQIKDSTDESKTFLEPADVRLYPGVITAYAIFTTRSMLVNISTLHGPVYDNFTLIAEDKPDPNCIFKRFRANHFAQPWQSEKTVRLDDDNNLLLRLLEINFSSKENRFKEGEWPPTIPQDVSGVTSHGNKVIKEEKDKRKI